MYQIYVYVLIYIYIFTRVEEFKLANIFGVLKVSWPFWSVRSDGKNCFPMLGSLERFGKGMNGVMQGTTFGATKTW